jgi:uncharacterized protein
VTSTDVIAVGAGFITGILISIVAGGGGLFLVPALTFGLGVPMAQATGVSLGAVLVAALFGLWGHARARLVRWKAALLFGVASMPAAQASAHLHSVVPERAALLGFSALLAVLAVKMLRAVDPDPSAPRRPARPLVLIGGGVGVGLLSGFFGIGGGFLAVPTLSLGLGLTLPEAVGTSVVVIFLTSLGGTVGHLRAGTLPIELTLKVAAGAALGALLGSALAGKMKTPGLRRALSVLLLAVAALTVWKALRLA